MYQIYLLYRYDLSTIKGEKNEKNKILQAVLQLIDVKYLV